MSEYQPAERVKTSHRIRGFFIHVVLLLVAFLLGFVPMWWLNTQCAVKLSDVERRSSLVKMQNVLGAAAIDARRGQFEAARQAASDFFTFLRAETTEGVNTALSQAQIDAAEPLFTRRDQIITLLARGDAASADMLSDLYVEYRKLVNP